MANEIFVSACLVPPLTEGEINNRVDRQKENYRKRRLVTVGSLIRSLKKFDADLPVCLADWNEQYQADNNEAAGIVTKRDGQFYATEDDCYGEYIAIGG